MYHPQPPISSFESYVCVIDVDGCQSMVPRACLYVSDTLRRLYDSPGKFVESTAKPHSDCGHVSIEVDFAARGFCLDLSHLDVVTVRHLIRYSMQYYLESYAVFRPVDSTSFAHGHFIEPTVRSLDSEDLTCEDSVKQSIAPLVIQYTLTAREALPIFFAAHYLQMAPLLKLSATLLAQHL